MEATIEQKLKALYKLQSIDSKIDAIKSMRGELPMEVSDLEDEIVGLETRLAKLDQEIAETEGEIASSKISIKEAQALKKKYEGQVNSVKNNREFDAINKEIEMKELEVMAAEKHIRDFQFELERKAQVREALASEIEGRKIDLKTKNEELDSIVAETEKEEAHYQVQRDEAVGVVDERLLSAYNRIRRSLRNGIAVARIERDSCSGCFASIPPQRQLDIRQRKKIIVCEHCSRVLVDSALAEEISQAVVEA